MSDRSVSVILPVRNGERYIAEALASLFGQTRPPTEVIVVDDGSTDRSAEIAGGFPVQLIRIDATGVSAARNAGLAAADGDLIAFIDHDDIWEPLKLERQIRFLDEHPGVGFATCWLRVVVEAGTDRPSWVEDEYMTAGLPGMCPGVLLVRREVIDRVGGFDTNLALGEDADWVLRAADAGVRRAAVDEVLLRYRIHGANTTVRKPVTAPVVFNVLRMALARRHGAVAGGDTRAR